MELVTGAMGSLLPKLRELLKEEYNLQRGMREQVQSLSGELEIMHATLRKVEEVPREQLDPLVKLWARDIRELFYDMEDVVDTHLVRVEDGREATPNPDMRKWLIEKMIQDISKQLQEVTNKHRGYPPSVPAASTPIDPRLQALYREATELIGINGKRDQELIEILSEGDDMSKKKLKTVSVVGFGGLGKTTLVRAVYDKIKGDFDCWAFVFVGRNPDVKKVFKDILLDLDKQKYTKEIDLTVLDERKLIDEIREFLENERYLIIIDDIWDEKLWGVIKCAFSKRNNRGSRLITTTRKVNISEACCSSSDDIVYKMEPLSHDDSQSLFFQRIFPDKNGCPRELKQVSKDIMKKCGGVPLAISTIASLLASHKQTKDEWYTLLNSIGCGLSKHTCVEEMQRILSFSYYDLPSHLKTCLLYLSIFPKDYKIDRDRLIRRWIAEGFIQCDEQHTSLFELGESYFNELINRSMIQPEDINWEGSARACRVHDNMLDLICALSSEENFITILDGTEQSTSNSQSKVHRLSLQNISKVAPLVSMSQVRSILIFRRAINLMPPLSSFDVLRVLDLRGCHLGESSRLNLRDVGNLSHLRYLDLARTYIHELPEEIGELKFLQVLDVSGNIHLTELPSTVVKLRRLTCLLGQFCTKFPDGMGNLTSMEVLHWISTKGCPNIVKELHNLTRLRELKIKFGEDESSKELEEAFVESLGNLHNIQILDISGCFRSMDLLGGRWVPPRHLRRFHLHGFVASTRLSEFSTLPAWVKRDPSLLSDLSELCIDVKELRQEDLQILGRLPALHSLFIRSTPQTQRLLLVNADGFHSMMCFKLTFWSFGHLMFQRGALPRAQEVYFPFDVRMAQLDGNGEFDSGLGNLLSLRKVRVAMFRGGATVREAKEVEAALRHAVKTHPNHPTIEIVFAPDIPESDDDECDGEESTESDDDDICDGEDSTDGDDDGDGPEKSS